MTVDVAEWFAVSQWNKSIVLVLVSLVTPALVPSSYLSSFFFWTYGTGPVVTADEPLCAASAGPV